MSDALRLDIGCGKTPKEGFIGVDAQDFGQPIVFDVRGIPWKWEDDSVDEVYCSHLVEHLIASDRILFANELYRVLKPGAEAEIIVPHWGSGRAYGDLTHQWPPVSEFWFLYLSSEWREKNAPHTDARWSLPGMPGYTCDFQVEWGCSLAPNVVVRNHEFQQFASTFYKDANQDIVSTWKKPEAT